MMPAMVLPFHSNGVSGPGPSKPSLWTNAASLHRPSMGTCSLQVAPKGCGGG